MLALVVATPLGAALWSYLRFNPINNVWFIPFVWAFALAWVIGSISGGTNRWLRVSLLASIVCSFVFGNLITFYIAVDDILKAEGRTTGLRILRDSPAVAIEYVRYTLQNWPDESTYLFGGLIGGWLGVRWLAKSETVEVQ